MEEAPIAPKRSWRPRFSLLTVMLLMTIVGMGISIRQLWREVGPLRADNKRLSEERGTLVVGDPNKLHAIEIPARFAGEDRQSFRVYVPPGQKYLAFVQVNDVPKTGIPERKKLPGHAGILGKFQDILFARLGSGDHVVTVRTVRRGGTADIQLIVGFASPRIALDASAMTAKDRWPTVVPETFKVFGGGVDSATVAVDGTEPLVLLRYRIQGVSRESLNVTYTTPEPDFPLDGMILWLEREPKQPTGWNESEGVAAFSRGDHRVKSKDATRFSQRCQG